METYKKNRKTPITTSSQYANVQHLQDHEQKVTRKKLNYLQNIFPKFSLHNDQDQEVEQDLATAIQSQERLKAFTLKVIKDEIKC